MGIIDLASGVLTYVNAGHEAPYLKRAGENFEPLPSRGCFALGSMANVPYWTQSVQLVQGDLLFMYTGGLTGACDKKGEEFSDTRLLKTLNGLIGREYAIEHMAAGVEAAAAEFIDGAQQDKDIAMLLFRYLG